MAEVLLNRIGEGKFQAFSAGSRPSGAVNPLALRTLSELRESTAGLRSKSWDEFAQPDSPVMDFVFTVCGNAAAETCPVWQGTPVTGHWGVDDPAAVTGSEEDRLSAFREAYRLLERRIQEFVTQVA